MRSWNLLLLLLLRRCRDILYFSLLFAPRRTIRFEKLLSQLNGLAALCLLFAQRPFVTAKLRPQKSFSQAWKKYERVQSQKMKFQTFAPLYRVRG